MLLLAERPEEALEAFEKALKSEPGRFWALEGAGRAAKSVGDLGRAKSYYRQLVAQTSNADARQEILARAFVESVALPFP